MSILTEKLRAVLFSNLRPDMSRVQRQAAWDLFNAIDSDLDIANFIPSSTTDEVVEAFDHALKTNELPDLEDEPEDEEEEIPLDARFNISDDDLANS